MYPCVDHLLMPIYVVVYCPEANPASHLDSFVHSHSQFRASVLPGTASQSLPHGSAMPAWNNDFVSSTKLLALQPCLGQQHWTFPRHATEVGSKNNIASLVDNVKALRHQGLMAQILHRAHPDLSQGPADLQSAALSTELCTHVFIACSCTYE